MNANALTASAVAARNIGDLALAEQLLRQALEAFSARSNELI